MKRIIITAIVLSALFIGLILCNFYCISIYIPEWVSVLFGVLMLVLNIFLFRAKGRKAPKIIVSSLSLLTVCFGIISTYCIPYWNSCTYLNHVPQTMDGSEMLTPEQALRDVECARKYLAKVHPAAKDGLPQEVSARFDEIEEEIRSQDGMTVYSLERMLCSAAALFHDGHTMVYGKYPEYRHLKYVYSHNQAGDRLIAVNGTEQRELYEQNKQYFSFDSGADDYGYSHFRTIITRPDGLALLGIDIEDGVVYTFAHPDGSTEDVTAHDEDFLTIDEYYAYNKIEPDPTESSFVSYAVDEEKSLAMLTLNSCTYDEEYCSVLHDMFSEVKEKGIRNVAVDLRSNGGGSSMVGTEFLKYLPVDSYMDWAADRRFGFLYLHFSATEFTNKKYADLTFDGNVYVLTSGDTYSSAMDFAMYIKDNGLGKIVGEASLNDPYGYGEVTRFRLPDSGLMLIVSTAKWYRIDTDTPEKFIEPDIPCPEEEAEDKLAEVLSEK